jgi:cyclin-dependent kinase 8/11
MASILSSGRAVDKKHPGNNYTAKVKISQKYNIIGFISSGTYGRVYKAVERNPKGDPSIPVGAAGKELYAIKK